MSEQREHINQYSAKDIQRYLKGELSPSEMHAMEKAALDDPFLADAMEGMEETMNAHGESLINANLESLQQQVQNRIANKNSNRVIAMRWWYAAAAVVLITGSIWIYNGSLNKSPKDSMAQLVKANQSKTDTTTYKNIETLPVAEKDKVMGADTAKASPELKAVTKAKNNRSIKKNGRQLSFRKRDNYHYKLSDSLIANLSIASGKSNVKLDTSQYAAASFSTSASEDRDDVMKKIPGKFDGLRFDSIETETVHVKPAAKIAANYKDDKAKLRNVISGRVVDPFDHPLFNANVISLDNRVLLNTDQYGFFKMASSDTSVNVTVSLSGYNTQNFTLQNNAALNNIQLQPIQIQDIAKEKSNVGNQRAFYEAKTSSTDNNLASITNQDAQPVSGWVNFEQYLIRNRKPPSDNPNLKGQVVVSFIVNKKTGLSDFKIEEHLAKGYDEEAIRLVKEGPQWKLLKGKKTKVLVVVHF